MHFNVKHQIKIFGTGPAGVFYALGRVSYNFTLKCLLSSPGPRKIFNQTKLYLGVKFPLSFFTEFMRFYILKPLLMIYDAKESKLIDKQ